MGRIEGNRHAGRGALKRCVESALRVISAMTPPSIFEWGERFCAVAQGKGWGTATIATEVSACLALLHSRPESFVDIGANVGNYTAEVLKRCPDVRCLVIEPAKLNMSKLRERFGGQPHMALRQCALASESGHRTLYSDIEGSGLASLTKRDLVHRDIDMELREAVQTMRFDELSSTWLMPGGANRLRQNRRRGARVGGSRGVRRTIATGAPRAVRVRGLQHRHADIHARLLDILRQERVSAVSHHGERPAKDLAVFGSPRVLRDDEFRCGQRGTDVTADQFLPRELSCGG